MSRTGVPSSSSEPMARVSPMPQSIVPSSTIAARRWSCGSSRGWTVTCSGMFTWEAAIRLTTSEDTAVGTATGNSDCEPDASCSTGAAVASRTSVKTFSSWPW